MPRRRLPELDFADLVRDKLIAAAWRNDLASPEILRELGARDALDLRGSVRDRGERRHVLDVGNFVRLSDIARNNCTVAILSGIASLALAKKKYFSSFETILVPSNASLLSVVLGLFRYERRGVLQFNGWTSINYHGRRRTFAVLKNRLQKQTENRLYGPSGVAPLEILRSISDLNYVLLRSIEKVESGERVEDVDILISADDVEEFRKRLDVRIGVRPLNVYTDTWEFLPTYRSAPCFKPTMAREILASAERRVSGIKVPSIKWRYIAFCYHLLFHNKLQNFTPGKQELAPHNFKKPADRATLLQLAKEAGYDFPRTLTDIERVLIEEEAFPGIDLIGFYSANNPFLKQRYLVGAEYPPGLTVVFLRDFGEGFGPVPDVRRKLEEKFHILAEGPIAEARRPLVEEKVRGGNWYDIHVAGKLAPPVYWFACWDEVPVPPSRRTRRKYSRVDNENVRIKDEVRREAGGAAGESIRLVHSGDSTAEALEHIALLGIAELPEVAAVIERVTRSRNSPDPRPKPPRAALRSMPQRSKDAVG